MIDEPDQENIADNGNDEDVAAAPDAKADPPEEFRKFVSPDLLEKYEIYSYGHAAAILKNSFPGEFAEIEDALRRFTLSRIDIGLPGGNESVIPKKFSEILRPLSWFETRIQGDLLIRIFEKKTEVIHRGGQNTERKVTTQRDSMLPNYVDGHQIDYVKGRVAFDMEWNSKDQTFDRDLAAFKLFHECGVISVGILVTRSQSLNPLLENIPRRKKDGALDLDKDGNQISVRSKYGASTTWMGKLLYRLNANRNGGCPVLVVGITPNSIND